MTVMIPDRPENHPGKKVIVVGAGAWGKNLVRNFHDLNALAAVVELNPNLRQQLAEQYADLPVHANYEEALGTEVPAIVIATPAPSHYPLALAALKAGKDVFVEKPMTLEREQAQELATLADQQGQILMVGHLLLYQPAITWIQDYLRSGQAGEVWHVATRRLKLGRVRPQENVWWSFAPHDLAVILALLNQPAIAQIQTHGRTFLQPGIADTVQAHLTFATGQTAALHCSWYWPLVERSTVIITAKQMIVYDEVAQTVTLHHKSVDQNLQNCDEGTEVIDIAHSQPLKLECQHFLDCLASRNQPRSDGWQGVAVVDILAQVQQSLESLGTR